MFPYWHNSFAVKPSISSCSKPHTTPCTRLLKFLKKMLRISNFEKLRFFESAILDFFLKEKISASFPWKSVTNYLIEWMGLNFDGFPGFQQISCYLCVILCYTVYVNKSCEDIVGTRLHLSLERKNKCNGDFLATNLLNSM